MAQAVDSFLPAPSAEVDGLSVFPVILLFKHDEHLRVRASPAGESCGGQCDAAGFPHSCFSLSFANQGNDTNPMYFESMGSLQGQALGV